LSHAPAWEDPVQLTVFALKASTQEFAVPEQ
jgi:hypothetical protein